MTYWIILIILFTVLIAVGIFIWKKKIKDDNMEKEDFMSAIFIGSISLVAFIIFAIDLPSAISGGKEIYVNVE